jgi:hypothetical protein
MKFSRKQKTKKQKAAELAKKYVEFKAVKRLAKFSPLVAAGAVAAAVARKRGNSSPGATNYSAV